MNKLFCTWRNSRDSVLHNFACILIISNSIIPRAIFGKTRTRGFFKDLKKNSSFGLGTILRSHSLVHVISKVMNVCDFVSYSASHDWLLLARLRHNTTLYYQNRCSAAWPKINMSCFPRKHPSAFLSLWNWHRKITEIWLVYLLLLNFPAKKVEE